MNESETRAELIDPAIASAGWGTVPGSRVAREQRITLGRLHGQGGGRPRQPGELADYVLHYRGQMLAVVEAKSDEKPLTEGLRQAKQYAEKLETPFAYCTNGRGLYRVDMRSGEEEEIEHRYPSPDDLWRAAFGEQEELADRWRAAFGAVPYEDRGGMWQPRYYQHNAIRHALEAVASGRDRVLLTMATGTGKTAVAFQIVWKLFHARWSLANRENPDAETRRPRVLFLADRNLLANKAFNAFGAFEDKALVRIDPKNIRKKGGVPTNGSVFFTIFQTFMTPGSGDDEDDPEYAFGELPPDFFDLIIIDECHRGGAKDESQWRGILEYFSPAVQLGLTATPRRTANADTYNYFGEPVYTYSLKEGINDGFLTPFKVRRVSTTLDEYRYTSDDTIETGEIDREKRYTEADFNRVIEIKAREAKRVELFMESLPAREKTLVFCATQDHALAVRDLGNQLRPDGVTDANYCCRVTANDGDRGEADLKAFQDNEKTIPTILTTSQKLSTGVDALNVRHIVLMRPVKSMIEFKQIIGRGTRLFEGKQHFTIHDFVKAYEHFNDPEWDGEPVQPEPAGPRPEPPGPGSETPPPPPPPREKIKVTLAPGKERLIDSMVHTSCWDPDGRPISAAEFLQKLYGDLPELFQSENELRRLWGDPETRRKLLEGLVERGYSPEQLRETMRLIDAGQSDLYDVLAYLAFETPTVTRAERVANRLDAILDGRDEAQRTFLEFVLGHYIDDGIDELSLEKLPHLLELKYGGTADAAASLGGPKSIRETFTGFQPKLYLPEHEIAAWA